MIVTPGRPRRQGRWWTWRRFNALRAAGYLAMAPIGWWQGWQHSVAAVYALSITALVESCIAAVRADSPSPR